MWCPRIHKTPLRLQIEAIECGATALGIILEYFGSYVSPEKLRVATKVSRNGADAKSLIEGAQSFGLVMQGKRLLVSDLKTLKWPSILFFDQGHFVVLEGQRKGLFYINDPAQGRYMLNKKDMHHRYSGVVLVIDPGSLKPNFINQVKSTLNRAVKDIFSMSYKAALLGVIAGIFLSLDAHILGVLAKAVVDNVNIAPKLLLFSLALVNLSILIFLWYLFYCFAQEKINTQLLAQNEILLAGLFKVSSSFFDQRPFRLFSDAITKNFYLLEKAHSNKLTRTFYCSLQSTLLIFLYLSSKILFMAIVISLVLIKLTFYSLAKKADNNDLALVQMRERFNNLASLSLSNFRDLQAMGQNPQLQTRLISEELVYYPLSLKKSLLKYLKYTLEIFIHPLLFVLVAVICFKLLMVAKISLSELIATLVISSWLFLLAQKTSSIFFSNSEPIKKISGLVSEVVENKSTSILHAHLKNSLSAKNIVFKYPGEEKAILTGTSFDIDLPQTIALVSKPLAGKSTLLKIFAQIIKPEEGGIYLSSNLVPDFRSLLIDDYSSLFAGSLFDNIALFDPKISEFEVVKALDQALVNEVYYNRPLGLLAPILANGENLSGGQKKRVLLARALVHKPHMLFLDDFFCAMEEDLSLNLIKNLKKLNLSMITTFTRPKEFAIADRVMWLREDGQVLIGTHQSLFDDHEAYRKLIHELIIEEG